MERLRVLSGDFHLYPAALRESYVARREDVVEAKRTGDLARDEEIAGARHAEIQLREQQQIALADGRVLLKHAYDTGQTYPALYVPCGCANRHAGHPRESAAPRRLKRKALLHDAAQDSLDLRAERLIERRFTKRTRRRELSKLSEEGLQLVIECGGRFICGLDDFVTQTGDVTTSRGLLSNRPLL